MDFPIEEIRTIMFVALSLDSLFFAFSLKNLRKPLWKIRFLTNWYLVAALTLNVILLIATLTLSPLRALLSLTVLSSMQVILLIGIGLFNLATIEVTKYFIFERGQMAIETKEELVSA
tara:strand:- start:152 stop:505 length:354 start_codon:yes stop_codon:yes gene_type:complete